MRILFSFVLGWLLFVLAVVFVLTLHPHKARSEDNVVLPTVFYWSATWCGPCKRVWPMVVEWAQRHPEFRLVEKDYDRDVKERKLLAIQGVPVVVFVYKGNAWKYGEGAHQVGEFAPDNLDDWISNVYP